MAITEQNYAHRALAWIEAQIAAGKTVHFTTSTRTVSVSPKTVETWKKAGRDLLKITKDGLRVGRGKNYDLITTTSNALCKISAI